MPRKNAPPVGKEKCIIPDCTCYTDRVNGMCSKCESSMTRDGACCFCNGFGFKDGQRNYCSRHAGLFTGNTLRFQNDVTAHLAAQIMNDFYRSGFHRIRYAGNNDVAESRFVRCKFIPINPQEHRTIHGRFKEILQNLVREVAKIDTELTELYEELQTHNSYSVSFFDDEPPVPESDGFPGQAKPGDKTETVAIIAGAYAPVVVPAMVAAIEEGVSSSPSTAPVRTAAPVIGPISTR